MEFYAERHSSIILKDHKENFKQNTKCRLSNPEKGEIERMSKKYLEQIIIDVNNITGFDQWRDTSTFIKCLFN